MSQITKLSARGQVAIPKAIRTARKWKAGTEFVIQETSDGVLLKAKKRIKPPPQTKSWSDLVGVANYRGPRRSLRDMDRGVLEEARKHA
jgi:AbrB family looped-hinge helix DNA binding protein